MAKEKMSFRQRVRRWVWTGYGISLAAALVVFINVKLYRTVIGTPPEWVTELIEMLFRIPAAVMIVYVPIDIIRTLQGPQETHHSVYAPYMKTPAPVTPAIPVQENTMPLNIAVRTLREKIIRDLENSQQPQTRYEIASLLWDDAHYFDPHWDGAWIYLDLKTGKLSLELSTYPNALGQTRSINRSMTTEEFHKLALAKKLAPELQAFRTDAVWARLLNDELKAAIRKVTDVEEA